MDNSVFDNNTESVKTNGIFDEKATSSASGTVEENGERPQQVENPESDSESSNEVYSNEELNDPSQIDVTISDTQAPLVILFGPPSCGKTMTLVRLTRYLSQNGYEVIPEKNFRPAHDRNYSDLCSGFNTLISCNDAAENTQRINFMLVKVIMHGRTVCQLLEAPGEFYFNPANPTAGFPNFINTILNKENRKIWGLMVEPQWSVDSSVHRQYVAKINSLKVRMRPKDRVMIVFNKIDLANGLVVSPGHVHISDAVKTVSDLYPGIFIPFKNNNPITSFWRSYNCKFVPFQTGTYDKTTKGTLKYQEGPVEYPIILWRNILSCIKG